jgi:hypothetical protein
VSAPRRKDSDVTRRYPLFGGVVRADAASLVGANAMSGFAALKSEVRDITRRNYGESLRGCLSRWEVKEIAGAGKTRVWPSLNREPVTLVSRNEFVRRWSEFGVDFKFASLPWKEGLSLLGFYVTKIDRVRKRPLIFVNTAHHPAVVGVALFHEMGHHLTAQIFAERGRTHLLSPTGFEEHLTAPAELAADTLVSLGIFPAPIARALFGRINLGGESSAGKSLSEPELTKVLEYIGHNYRFAFDQIRGTKRKLQALAGLVHYTKLRRALLDEYQI